MVAVLKPGFTVRDMQENDIPGVLKIEQQSYPFPWTAGIFRDCVRVGYQCFVLEVEQQIAGYSIISVFTDECHILNFCIAEAYRGEHLGRRFMEYVLKYAASLGAQAAHLEVRPSNKIARTLYLSLGFTQIGVRKNYYPAEDGREDALVLAMIFDVLKSSS